MTDNTPPSAAALDLIEEFIDRIAALPRWDKALRRKAVSEFGCAIDAFVAQAVAAATKSLVSICPHPAKCEEMAVAAERAKPDFIAALRAEVEQMEQWERLCLLDSTGNTVYITIDYLGDGGEYDALDEGAKVKSERAAAIRNQTLTGE